MNESYDAHGLATLRTEWAAERTRMAQERTFVAWLRTGLALMAAGLAAGRLLSSAGPLWLIQGASVALILAACAVFAGGFWTVYEVWKELQEGGVGSRSVWFYGALTGMLVVIAVVALVLVFL